MKKYISIIIAMAIFGFLFILFAAWSKITDKTYADTALTIGMFLEIGIIAIALIWLFIEQKSRKASL